MTTISLNLDGDSLRDATVQAMLGVLTPEVRAQVLEKAIQAILAPSTNSWDRKKSPIELAFEAAVENLARQEAKRIVDEDTGFRDQIKALLRTTADKVLAADMDKLAERMAAAFAESMRKD
jgi:hypothetical protein